MESAPDGASGNSTRVSGGLLIGVGVLVLVASIVPLGRVNLGAENGYVGHVVFEMFAWKTVDHSVGSGYAYTDIRLVGIAFEVVALLAVVSGVLLLAGRRLRGGPWFGAFASGSAIAVTVIMMLSVAASDGISYGVGFWLLLLALIGAIAALVPLVGAKPIAPPSDAGGAADRVGAVFVILAAAIMAAAEVVTLTRGSELKSGVALPLANIEPLVSSVAATVAGVLVAVLGRRHPSLRLVAGIAIGLVFGSALAHALFMQYAWGLPTNLDQRTFSFAGMVLAALISLPAAIGGLVAVLAKPRLQNPRPQGYAFGLMPQPAPNPFAPVPNVEATVKLPPQPPRMAKVYDGKDAEGRPVVERAVLEGNLRTAVLAYLESAPVVLAARSFEQDEFVPGERDVPLTFRTDGTWVWAGAVAHYLHKHGLPPEEELVRHITARGFQVGEVGEAARQAAVRVITAG
ncbi:hypothetical protein VMT65_18505 [Nocardia sp. CDC153]|uniref:hypothetical protein n=1 Tax=Nocardia sp. CDC153 TaxID=3112167 RepID=UPI002DB9BFFE|nr:hypothetical protein [Nocardia sp. CDC153]MEC3955039.1 hypothetical protein [Nocardia sp. CDC153]